MAQDHSRYIEVAVRGIAVDQASKVPILLLEDVGRRLLLPVWIGMSEANAIASVAEQARQTRPMTHDLMTTLLHALEAQLDRVDICGLDEGTFYANMVLSDIDGFEHHLDCRPSDGVALALRTGAPIRVAVEVFAAAQTFTSDSIEEPPEMLAPMALADDDDGRDRLAQWMAESDLDALSKYKM